MFWRASPAKNTPPTPHIDLLYRAGDDWMILDFKTDRADSEEQARATIQQNDYSGQLAR